MPERIDFWIDVGGTFTDCFASYRGKLVRHKVLSSGVTKGAVGKGSTRGELVDVERMRDPEGFWNDYRLTLFDTDGKPVADGTVREFDQGTGRLILDAPLDAQPATGQPYELTAGEEAPLLAIRYLLGLGVHDDIPPVAVRLGTTRGTNALITRRGAWAAFVTTRGFGDLLRIGNQDRPRLFDLAIKKPEPLFVRTLEVDERVTHDGEVLASPDPKSIRQDLKRLRAEGVESIAICFLHAHLHPAHEELVARIAAEVGFEEVSVSSRVAPLEKIVSRGDTTVVDAYLNPVLRAYLAKLRAAMPGCNLRVLTSAGGLVDAEHFVGKDSILSGPAGGVVGFSRVALAAGFKKAIGFDMGGTSTDVSRFDGSYRFEFETEKAGVRVVAPMMAIETVAAGGGSICWFDGVKLAVGPDSAGAQPGPACYGRGGPLAVTDMNLFLGRIPPERFPFPLNRPIVEAKLAELCAEIAGATGKRYTPHELADGFLQVANANMAKAIASISISQGVDHRDYVLVAFGGAAPQHACGVARQLGMRKILNHPDGGILSAYGIGLADVVRHQVAGVYEVYSGKKLLALESTFERLAEQGRRDVLAEGVAEPQIECVRSLDLRYLGVDAYLNIPRPTDGDYVTAYIREHRNLYGYEHPDRPIEIVAARLQVIGRSEQMLPESRSAIETKVRQSDRITMAYFDAQRVEAQRFDRDELQPGDLIDGPAIVAEDRSTTVIEPGWRAEVFTNGELLLVDQSGGDAAPVSTESDPVTLEIFNNHMAGIAEQMGITLRNTASSVNVKERLDFSCAVFTAAGDLVVNAPHIPVHLGAMAETVRHTIADNPGIRPGDVFVTNDPYRGGSHLPDITVVTPVHDAESGRLLFFTASRAHHAEIGGITPGSAPPFSRNLAEEGVLIRNFKLVDAGCSRVEELGRLLLSAEYPTRNVDDNLSDIAAQTAANRQGARDLAKLVESWGLPAVEAFMGHIQDAAAEKMRRALARRADARRTFVDHLDDGSPIAVALTIAGDHATIDFTGTGPVLPGNLNANRAIVTAAVMYCLLLLIDEDIPLNQGVLSPVDIVLPECLLNPAPGATAAESPAVVGGNTETSQRVVDALLGALGIAAASQGTMNNLVFGDGTFGYYETICGGSGATADADGADAVQTHMTNTRLTDPEVLERRVPVRLLEFAIRRGSGGTGKHRGGDGVIRRIEFLRELNVSLLTQRRGPYAPYGVQGGDPGALGENRLCRADGTLEVLPGQTEFTAQPGDQLIIKTPGGGGFGK